MVGLWSCYVKGRDGRLVSAIGSKLSISPEVRILLHSEARLVQMKWFLVLFYCLPAISPGLTVLSPHHLNMVRQHMRSHSGERGGSQRHSKASCSMDPALPHVTIPSSPVDLPPPSDTQCQSTFLHFLPSCLLGFVVG